MENNPADRQRAAGLSERLSAVLAQRAPVPQGRFLPHTSAGIPAIPMQAAEQIEGALDRGPPTAQRFPEQRAAPSGSWPAPVPPALSSSSFPATPPPAFSTNQSFPASVNPSVNSSVFPSPAPPSVSADVRFPSAGAPASQAAPPWASASSPTGGGGEVIDLLRRIATAVERLGQGGGAPPPPSPSHGGQTVFSYTAGEHPDASEHYPAASPSVNVSSTGGLRGAGGWGFGSRVPSAREAMSKEFLEPGHRMPRVGG